MILHRADVGVVGGGPAGTTIATRLAQLGHSVVLVDRERTRHRTVELLAPGTVEILAMSGAVGPVRSAGFASVRSSIVDWDDGPTRREMPQGGSLLVDRDAFDAILLAHAGAAGVEMIRPATARRRVLTGDEWSLSVDAPQGDHEVRCGFLVDATGRSARHRHERVVGPHTLAVSGRWIGDAPPSPTVVAAEHGWIWAVPVPARERGRNPCSTEITAFVDPAGWRSSAGSSPAGRYRALVESSGLVGRGQCRLAGRVVTVDATPAALCEPAATRRITVGDAAVSLDPLSSTGVQKAIQTALSAAVVVNTVLRRPAHAALALDHHRATLAADAAQHAAWAAESYAAVAARHPTAFWLDRAMSAQPDGADRPAERALIMTPPRPETVVRVSPLVQVVDVACVTREFVAPGSGVRHPGLDGEVAYLDGVELVPLLATVRSAAPLSEIAAGWSSQLTADAAWRIAGWLYRHGVLEGADAA